jgi:tetratricopeptide (TPR) repeat protein
MEDFPMKPFVSLFVSLVFICLSSFAQAPASAPQSPFTTAVDLVDQGKLSLAASVLEKEVQVPNRTNLQRGRACALLAYTYKEQGRFDLAEKAFDRALRLMDKAGDRSNDYAATLDFYAGMLMTTGDFDTAAKALREATHVYESVENHVGLSQIHTHTAELLIERHKYKEAEQRLAGARAEALLANVNFAAVSEIDATTGWLAIATGRYHDGVAAYSTALEKCRREWGESNAITGWSYLLLGKAQGLDHDVPEAESSMQKGLAILKKTEGTNSVRYVAGELAYSELLEHAGSHAEAARINSDANTTIRNLRSQQCAQCTVSVWSLRHQGGF